ncbi:MAG: ATP-dependent DNA helicase [Candidatus Saccharimonadales bacterium]
MQKTDVAPQNILCLTYTEVGARNMRERLTKLIGQSAYDIRISTYHGFGSDIIRTYNEYFNEFGAEQAVDALGQDAILQNIFATLPASNPLWRAEVYLKDSLGLISEFKRALLSPQDVRNIATNNQAFITKASDIVLGTIPEFARINKDVVSHFAALLAPFNKLASTSLLASNIQPLANICITDLAEALGAFDETGKTNSITVWKNKWLVKNIDNKWVLGGAREVKKLFGAADVYEQYLQALKAQKLFDYDDMITRAIHGLEQNDDLRFTLHEQYQYVMLDEFQDTNLAQLRLVELLTNNPVLNGQANVLAVGDDDQAIYSFQGAELTNMVRFTNMYKDVQIIALTDNYRSHADILESAHAIASQIEERLGDVLGGNKEQLHAKNETIKKAHIVRTQLKSDIAQYDFVARETERLIKQGTRPEEIAILAPRHKYLEPLVPYLQAKQIAVRYDKRENVLDDYHVAELLTMAELILALADNNQSLADSMWPSVLSADFWQLPTSAIWQLSWQASENYYAKEGETHWQALMMHSEQFKPIMLFFTRLSQIVTTETLETMLDYIVGVTPVELNEPDLKDYLSPYYEFYFGPKERANEPDSFTSVLSNLTVLRQHLREYRRGENRPLQLQDLLDFVADYRNAGEKLLNTSPYHSSTHAVQLMTAYGSKGLEFDAVFVLATQDDAWGMKARDKSSTISLPPNLQIIRRAGSSKDEKKRLFYVAITRAKQSLYLVGYDQNYAGKSTEPLEFLNESDGIARALPSHHQNVIQSDSDAPAIEALEHYWTTRHAEGSHKANLRDLVLPRLETFQLSATHLNTFTDLVYGGPDAFFMNTVLRFPKAPTADGQYGNAIHETLEALQYHLRKEGELPDIDLTTAIFIEKLKAKRLSDNDFNRQKVRGEQALAAFLPQWWHNFIPEAQSEYDFKHEGSFVGEAHLSGKLDQLLIDAESKAIRIVDFKTGKSHARWTNDVKMHKYKQQLLFYKLLVESSHSFKNYTVTEAQLTFVEPDDNDRINDLAINYQAEDIERTKQLIQAIWKRIITLDLPDTSQFSADLKGIIAFEDWLIDQSY